MAGLPNVHSGRGAQEQGRAEDIAGEASTRRCAQGSCLDDKGDDLQVCTAVPAGEAPVLTQWETP